MKNYYILSVDSFQDTFTRIDAGKDFYFELSVQNISGILSVLHGRDTVIVYRKSPVSGCTIVLQVVENTGNKTKFRKVFEIGNVVYPSVPDHDLENEYLVEISSDVYGVICKQMLDSIQGITEVNIAEEEHQNNLKQRFEQYILHVLKLKSTRQVGELEKLSDRLVANGVLERGVYQIDNIDDYSNTLKKIRESEEYITYKSERKEKNPNSGLACDQGMSNYLKFLEYLAAKEENVPRIKGAENVLLYGVPGVGKSHEIQTKYCDDPERMERVVFHPDYTYSDFVGQILPKVENGKLKYEFTAGPFTTLLAKAWNNPGKEYYLVIEEINRGNAPAIFGEIFQLLDRKTEDSHRYDPSEYGESEYSITNSDIATAVFGDPEEKIRIPSNMWILATMNTADQNVFTLDTAFQRRWKLHHMKNDVMSAGHSKAKIEGSEIEWGTFASVINEMVTDYSLEMMSSEDKRLGAYFVKKNELSEEEFPEKVLKYLWDDAFKMKKDAVFDDKFKSLETIIETYELSEPDKLKSVLRLEVYQKMLSKLKNNTNDEES
jgi:5-methylcytosine-specific restriction endonuclease McrBC GTP-binding regulatory subunit McrB